MRSFNTEQETNNRISEEHPLKVMYSNCDCLTQSKLSELEQYIVNDSPDIIVLTEIFPKHSSLGIQVELFTIENYDSFFVNETEGWGVVIFVKKIFLATKLSFGSEFKEQIWCNLKISNSNSLIVGGIYRSPNSHREN